MKFSFVFILISFTSLLFAKKIKVGLCVDNIATDRWAIEIKTIENTIRSKGGIVYVKTALGSVNHQKDQVNELINTQKIDVLILVPVDKVKCAELVTLAQKNKVKVILYSRNVESAKADAFISFNPFEIGVTQANYVVKNHPNSNIILLGGPLKDFNSNDIEKGQLSIFDSSSINIISSTHVKAWDKKIASDEIKKIDSAITHPIDVIIAGNDLLAASVIKYYKTKNQSVKVIGLDAGLRACQRIANGTQDMSIYLNIQKSAYCAALVALELNNHHHANIDSKEVIHKNIDGLHTYYISSTVITSKNLLQITEELNIYSKQQVFGK